MAGVCARSVAGPQGRPQLLGLLRQGLVMAVMRGVVDDAGNDLALD